MAWILNCYANLRGTLNNAIKKEHTFYQTLRTQISNVKYAEKWVQDALGAETNILEKEPYFLRAKKIALEILGHCEHGSYLAVDDMIREYYEKQKTGKHKKVIKGYIKECKDLQKAVVLKFQQVEKGIKHLESLL